jgi:hypothetical protein
MLLYACLCLLLCLLQLGKKAARRAKRKTDLDKEFEEAEAGPDLVQLALLQSQMLEVGGCGWCVASLCMRRGLRIANPHILVLLLVHSFKFVGSWRFFEIVKRGFMSL